MSLSGSAVSASKTCHPSMTMTLKDATSLSTTQQKGEKASSSSTAAKQLPVLKYDEKSTTNVSVSTHQPKRKKQHHRNRAKKNDSPVSSKENNMNTSSSSVKMEEGMHLDDDQNRCRKPMNRTKKKKKKKTSPPNAPKIAPATTTATPSQESESHDSCARLNSKNNNDNISGNSSNHEQNRRGHSINKNHKNTGMPPNANSTSPSSSSLINHQEEEPSESQVSTTVAAATVKACRFGDKCRRRPNCAFRHDPPPHESASIMHSPTNVAAVTANVVTAPTVVDDEKVGGGATKSQARLRSTTTATSEDAEPKSTSESLQEEGHVQPCHFGPNCRKYNCKFQHISKSSASDGDAAEETTKTNNDKAEEDPHSKLAPTDTEPFQTIILDSDDDEIELDVARNMVLQEQERERSEQENRKRYQEQQDRLQQQFQVQQQQQQQLLQQQQLFLQEQQQRQQFLQVQQNLHLHFGHPVAHRQSPPHIFTTPPNVPTTVNQPLTPSFVGHVPVHFAGNVPVPQRYDHQQQHQNQFSPDVRGGDPQTSFAGGHQHQHRLFIPPTPMSLQQQQQGAQHRPLHGRMSPSPFHPQQQQQAFHPLQPFEPAAAAQEVAAVPSFPVTNHHPAATSSSFSAADHHLHQATTTTVNNNDQGHFRLEEQQPNVPQQQHQQRCHGGDGGGIKNRKKKKKQRTGRRLPADPDACTDACEPKRAPTENSKNQQRQKLLSSEQKKGGQQTQEAGSNNKNINKGETIDIAQPAAKREKESSTENIPASGAAHSRAHKKDPVAPIAKQSKKNQASKKRKESAKRTEEQAEEKREVRVATPPEKGNAQKLEQAEKKRRRAAAKREEKQARLVEKARVEAQRQAEEKRQAAKREEEQALIAKQAKQRAEEEEAERQRLAEQERDHLEQERKASQRAEEEEAERQRLAEEEHDRLEQERKAERKAAKKERRRLEREARSKIIPEPETRGVKHETKRSVVGESPTTVVDVTTGEESPDEDEKKRMWQSEMKLQKQRAAERKAEKKRARHLSFLREQERKHNENKAFWEASIEKIVNGEHVTYKLLEAEFCRVRKIPRESMDEMHVRELKSCAVATYGALFLSQTSDHRFTVVGSAQEDLNGRCGSIRSWIESERMFAVGLDTKRGGEGSEAMLLEPKLLEPLTKRPTQRGHRKDESFTVIAEDEFLYEYGFHPTITSSDIRPLLELNAADNAAVEKTIQDWVFHRDLQEEADREAARVMSQQRAERAERAARQRAEEEAAHRQREQNRKFARQREQEFRRQNRKFEHQGGEQFRRHMRDSGFFFPDFTFGIPFEFFEDYGDWEEDDDEGVDIEQRRQEASMTLGVDPDADPATIRKEYYRQARLYHPDKFQAESFDDGTTREDAEEHFKKIQSAYDTLTSGDDGDR